MKLAEFMQANSLSADDLANRLGHVSVSGVRKWLSGERQPDADVVERIAQLTSGAVTAFDMHMVRLNWLKSNRPEKFSRTVGEAA